MCPFGSRWAAGCSLLVSYWFAIPLFSLATTFPLLFVPGFNRSAPSLFPHSLCYPPNPLHVHRVILGARIPHLEFPSSDQFFLLISSICSAPATQSRLLSSYPGQVCRHRLTSRGERERERDTLLQASRERLLQWQAEKRSSSSGSTALTGTISPFHSLVLSPLSFRLSTSFYFPFFLLLLFSFSLSFSLSFFLLIPLSLYPFLSLTLFISLHKHFSLFIFVLFSLISTNLAYEMRLPIVLVEDLCSIFIFVLCT